MEESNFPGNGDPQLTNLSFNFFQIVASSWKIAFPLSISLSKSTHPTDRPRVIKYTTKAARQRIIKPSKTTSRMGTARRAVERTCGLPREIICAEIRKWIFRFSRSNEFPKEENCQRKVMSEETKNIKFSRSTLRSRVQFPAGRGPFRIRSPARRRSPRRSPPRNTGPRRGNWRRGGNTRMENNGRGGAQGRKKKETPAGNVGKKWQQKKGQKKNNGQQRPQQLLQYPPTLYHQPQVVQIAAPHFPPQFPPQIQPQIPSQIIPQPIIQYIPPQPTPQYVIPTQYPFRM